ncbi:alkylhydroperoxidase [Paenibacillus sp. VTT E-133280]|jgi:AhpD family alkylhydroperoxidase|uniref:carboxymuconolactone decarboxylase family protein n=1 Tax=unclassified Paenibacillus TaxID=185978 RepID=UPI000BA07254|nr:MULTISPECIES: carboxymuconolactone decarboxylase family protein [unclassified Paenibacillus]MDH6373414.1 AhpD family alkylhydroperoxidase [Paenibacillus sp. PastF-3]OZQ61699.1 alkylhydroperoxidase [Paenibacillus sp. VTT E-133280]OZQ86164.1 alkylhydroperoxidase [Paenibacillus sp. VTT E-133291]
MEQRMDLAGEIPAAYKAMMGLEAFVQSTGMEKSLLELIKIRASQINGCAFCIDMHTKDARKAGVSEQRIYMLNAWREAPFYSDEERAVLALTESVTLVTQGHVPDDVYSEAERHFDTKRLGEIIMAIVTINAWNRIAITTRMLPQ